MPANVIHSCNNAETFLLRVTYYVRLVRRGGEGGGGRGEESCGDRFCEAQLESYFARSIKRPMSGCHFIVAVCWMALVVILLMLA